MENKFLFSVALFGFCIMAIISCSSDHKVKQLEAENQELRVRLDSITSFYSELKFVTEIDNRDFFIGHDESYRVEVFTALLNGLELDSVSINDSVPNSRELDIGKGLYGPTLEFFPKEKGDYRFDVYLKSPVWSDRRIRNRWKVNVK